MDEGAPPPAPDTQYYSILTGQPKGLVQHHDHKKGTNKPLIVDVLTLEVQVMNSDGYFEPIGLQILNFYTAKPQDAENDIYPFGAHDCRIWAYKVAEEENLPQPVMGTWSYGQLIVKENARSIETIEDGPVWWSDDLECWGVRDRFPPF